MSSYTSISPDKLVRLIGTAHTPVLIDVRLDEDFNADPRVIPGAIRRSHLDTQEWAQPLTGRSAIVVCEKGLNLSEGVAAWLRNSGVAAEILEGGFVGWQRAKLPTVPYAKLPARDGRGRTVWVTRSRPKIDRIACPWLVRRFVDPSAVFLFVAASEVEAVGERFNATPFDIENVSLEPSRRALHVRCHDRGIRACNAAADCGWQPWYAPPIPGGLTFRRKRRDCLRRHLAFRACMMTIWSNSTPVLRFTTPSTAGAATRPGKRTIGRPTRQGHERDRRKPEDRGRGARYFVR